MPVIRRSVLSDRSSMGAVFSLYCLALWYNRCQPQEEGWHWEAQG